jgi:hypothetical protein
VLIFTSVITTKRTEIMTTIEIATDLTSNETNVKVNTLEELNKMITLVGEYNLFIWVGTWMTVGEFKGSNDLNELF